MPIGRRIFGLLAAGLLIVPAIVPFTVTAASQLGAARLPLDQLPQIANFQLVGSNPLVNPPGSRMSASGLPRGMNSALAIAKNCAYVGSRNGLQDVLIVDISNPARPEVAGSIPGIALSSSRELKAIEDLDRFIVGHFELGAGGATNENPTEVPGTVNNFRVYNIANCRAPVMTAEFDMGRSVWHEFYLWRDPKNTRRVLAYVSLIGGDAVPDLRVMISPTLSAVSRQSRSLRLRSTLRYRRLNVSTLPVGRPITSPGERSTSLVASTPAFSSEASSVPSLRTRPATFCIPCL